jgi:hypothetical protein
MFKYILLLFFAATVNAERPADVPQCTEVKRTVCPGERVVVVKKKKKKVYVRKPDAPIKERVVYIEKVSDAKPKRNIVSLYAQRKIVSLHTTTTTSFGSVSARTESQLSLVPGLQYQRLFDAGPVLGIGIDTQGEVQGSLGFNF